MFDSSQPYKTFAASASSMAADQSWASEPDDLAFGCECADPSLQIACWGQEAGEVQAPEVAS